MKDMACMTRNSKDTDKRQETVGGVCRDQRDKKKWDIRLQLQARGLALDTANDNVAGILGNDLVIVEHGEF